MYSLEQENQGSKNNGNYQCEFLQLKYKVGGDAYDANGKRYVLQFYVQINIDYLHIKR